MNSAQDSSHTHVTSVSSVSSVPPIASFTSQPQSAVTGRSYAAIVAIHILSVLGVAGFIITSGSSSDNAQVFSSVGSPEQVAPVDEISSADVAVAVAQLAGLDETTAVMNHADSVDTLLEKPVEDLVAAKPQIVETKTVLAQDTIEYVTVEGDTIESIAERYAVSADSIKWSNDLPAGRLSVGQVIMIPPVDGIVDTVKDGDTADTLADKFQAETAQLVAFNDAELSGIVSGQQIVIPGGEIEVAPAYVPSAVGFRAVYGPANGYDWGWCTWHAANRRIETGNPIPRNLGNANTWSVRAAASGMAVSDVPVAGAVLWHDQSVAGYVAGGLGHVAYVEAVNADGSILVSDMNSRGAANSDLSGGPAGGWSRVSYRTVTPDQFYRYNFIY